MNPAEHIAAATRRARVAAKMTQHQLAELCGKAGYTVLTQPRIAQIETGQRKLSAEELWLFCGILNVSPLDILPPVQDKTKQSEGKP